MINLLYSSLFIFALFICYPLSLTANEQDERIPFYEDYIESGQLAEFIKQAHEFLDQKADQAEAPRIALDLLMMGKAAEDLNAVVRGTDLLLFDYLSLSNYFLSLEGLFCLYQLMPYLHLHLEVFGLVYFPKYLMTL